MAPIALRDRTLRQPSHIANYATRMTPARVTSSTSAAAPRATQLHERAGPNLGACARSLHAADHLLRELSTASGTCGASRCAQACSRPTIELLRPSVTVAGSESHRACEHWQAPAPATRTKSSTAVALADASGRRASVGPSAAPGPGSLGATSH